MRLLLGLFMNVCVLYNAHLRYIWRTPEMPAFKKLKNDLFPQGYTSNGKGEHQEMSPDKKPTEVLDVRGEVCPYPDVKTQKKVKSMKSGEILEVLVDYPLSAERIPRSMEKSGHKILKVDKKGTSEWSILIKIK